MWLYYIVAQIETTSCEDLYTGLESLRFQTRYTSAMALGREWDLDFDGCVKGRICRRLRYVRIIKNSCNPQRKLFKFDFKGKPRKGWFSFNHQSAGKSINLNLFAICYLFAIAKGIQNLGYGSARWRAGTTLTPSMYCGHIRLRARQSGSLSESNRTNPTLN